MFAWISGVYVCLQKAFRKADWRSRRASNSIVRAV